MSGSTDQRFSDQQHDYEWEPMMFEKWRSDAIENLKQEVEQTDALAKQYERRAMAAPRVSVGAHGITRPRKLLLCRSRTYAAMRDSYLRYIDKIAAGGALCD